MLTVLEHAPNVRLPRLATHRGPMNRFFAWVWPAGAGTTSPAAVCARAGHAERRLARAGQYDSRFPAALRPRADVLGQKIAFRSVRAYRER